METEPIKKILIVDDDEDNRDLIRKALKKEEFEVHDSGEALEALDRADKIMPDLLILDIMMPIMNGYEVCEKIKSNPATKDILVLFLSAKRSETVKQSVEFSGGDDFMEKPFSPKELRAKVREMLQNRA